MAGELNLQLINLRRRVSPLGCLIIYRCRMASALSLLATLCVGAAASLPELPVLVRIPRSDWTSVKDLGAVGDGVADDTGAIQAGLDILAANGNGAGGNTTLYFPEGTYRNTATLHINNTNGIALLGVGRNCTLRWGGPSSQTSRMLWSSGNTRDIVEGRECSRNLSNLLPHDTPVSAPCEVTFDGAGMVGVGLDHDTHASYYETRELHRHLAFLNFLVSGVRVGANVSDANVPSAEMLFLNCIFANSTAGVSLLSWNGAC